MTDKSFELSLSSLAAIVLLCVATGIALGLAGISWIAVETPWLIFLTVAIGLVVLIVGGGTLLYFWGKNYMARG
jgi:hypothetical protein